MNPAELQLWPLWEVSVALVALLLVSALLHAITSKHAHAPRPRAKSRCRFGRHRYVPFAAAAVWVPAGETMLRCLRCGSLVMAG